MLRPLPRIVSTAAALLVAVLPAAAQTPIGQRTAPLPLPSVIDQDALDTLAARVDAAVFEVRTTTDLGPRFRPRYSEGTGAATLVSLGDDGTVVLLSSFAHVARADRVEVRVDGEWYDARSVHGTPMFDLVALEVDVPIAAEGALQLAEFWSLGGTVYCPARRDPGVPPSVVIGAFGAQPEDDYAYYVRGQFTHHNGYPIVDIDGRVLAVTSLIAPDNRGGVFAIPFGHVQTWRDEWDQLDPATAIGWEPRVRLQPLELRTGSDALDD